MENETVSIWQNLSTKWSLDRLQDAGARTELDTSEPYWLLGQADRRE